MEAYEPPFLGHIQFASGPDCPCVKGARRLTIWKLWHSLDADTRGYGWGFGALPGMNGHYLAASADGFPTEANTTWTIDRLTGLVTGPEFYQGAAMQPFPPGTTQQEPVVTYFWAQDPPVTATVVAGSPYRPDMVLADLNDLYGFYPAQILIVPWGYESTLGRAEVATLRWRRNPPSYLGPSPADGRAIQVREQTPGLEEFRGISVQSNWKRDRLQRQVVQFWVSGFFSVERNDLLVRWNREEIRTTTPKEYFYLERGLWEVESPPISESDLLHYSFGDYLVSIALGDRPPDGVPFKEVHGKPIVGGAC